MGTCIEAVAGAAAHGRWIGRGALHLSDVAAESCLARAHHRADELDLLVNVGLYKDHSIAEPALASIIQEDLGANPGHPPRAGHHGTFSFDLMNGGAGMVTAAQLIDGFITGHTARLAMIVAADADPSPRSSRQFPFAPAGGAVLLGPGRDGAGFQHFKIATFPHDAALFESHTRWDPDAGLLRRGRNVLEVYEAPRFASACSEHGIAVARELLVEAGVAPEAIDLVIASTYPRGFALDVARGLGIAEACVPTITGELTRAHTAGPILALDAAFESGQLARARHILFVTAGAGITIGAALYVNA
ncbi:MAG TPA: 3-oxoacyl-[acyl-carrier-protein] synthase III C-terminal domain-containing protein [Kofleriaceae bacterium]|nr:3-oxoacyl-[acyl-carrier-protein] synthase III C-terminal domain-containing protein [Kofleriaceae bacterium]